MKKIALIIISLIALSCSSDENLNNDNQVNQTLLLKRIYKNNLVYKEFGYNSNHKIESAKLFENNGDIIINEIYEYINDTIIVRTLNSNNEIWITKKYFETNNSTIKCEYYNTIELESYTLYYYSSNDCGYLSSEHHNVINNITFNSSIDYFDENCSNLETTIDSNATNQLVYKNKKNYDNKNYYLKSTLLDIFEINKIGNITENTYWNFENSIQNNQSYNSVFQFNSDNYPISENRLFLNGESVEYNYEYY